MENFDTDFGYLKGVCIICLKNFNTCSSLSLSTYATLEKANLPGDFLDSSHDLWFRLSDDFQKKLVFFHKDNPQLFQRKAVFAGKKALRERTGSQDAQRARWYFPPFFGVPGPWGSQSHGESKFSGLLGWVQRKHDGNFMRYDMLVKHPPILKDTFLFELHICKEVCVWICCMFAFGSPTQLRPLSWRSSRLRRVNTILRALVQVGEI